jgi:hypothetical protein
LAHSHQKLWTRGWCFGLNSSLYPVEVKWNYCFPRVEENPNEIRSLMAGKNASLGHD